MKIFKLFFYFEPFPNHKCILNYYKTRQASPKGVSGPPVFQRKTERKNWVLNMFLRINSSRRKKIMESLKIMRSFKLSYAHIRSWELPKPKTGETFKCLYLRLETSFLRDLKALMMFVKIVVTNQSDNIKIDLTMVPGLTIADDISVISGRVLIHRKIIESDIFRQFVIISQTVRIQLPCWS